MANTEKIKNTLMWHGWRALPAGRLAEEIGKNLDEYIAQAESAMNLRKRQAEVYDNHTRSMGKQETPTQTLQRLRLEAMRGNV